MDTERLLKLFLYAALLIIGIVIGIAFRHYYNLPIAETINIVDVGTLVVTIFLAVYIPEVLDRKLQVQRDKKDLIEKRIDELQALYRRVNLTVQGEEPLKPRDALIIRNILDVAQHKLDTIITLLTYSNMHVSFTDDINKIKSLVAEHRKILCLNDMDNPDFTFPDNIQEREENLYNKIDEITSLLIFKISEA